MEFPDPATEPGLQYLDGYLSSRSYISGYEATANDLQVFNAFKGVEPATKFVNARRWYRHIQFYSGKKVPDADEKIRVAISLVEAVPKAEVRI
jgi:hypothetical protein